MRRSLPWKTWKWPKIAKLQKQKAALEKEMDEFLLAADVDEETGHISTGQWDFPIYEIEQKIDGLRQQQLLDSAARWHVFIAIQTKDRWIVEGNPRKRKLTDQAKSELREAIFQRKLVLFAFIIGIATIIQAACAMFGFLHYDPFNPQQRRHIAAPPQTAAPKPTGTPSLATSPTNGR